MTAETAISLPVLLLVWAVCIVTILGLAAQVRCIDAAREVARAAARGESPTVLDRIARDLAPRSSTWEIQRSPSLVTVRVSIQLTSPVGGLRLPAISGEAVSLREADAPGVAWDSILRAGA